MKIRVIVGFPVAQLVKNPPQCGRPGFDAWVGKIPWRRERLPTPVFWPREFCGLYSPWDCKELDMTEQLSLQGNRNGNFVLIFIRTKFCSRWRWMYTPYYILGGFSFAVCEAAEKDLFCQSTQYL